MKKLIKLLLLGAVTLASLNLAADENQSADAIGAQAATRLAQDVAQVVERGVILDASGQELSADEARRLQEAGRVQVQRQGLLADLSNNGGSDCATLNRPAERKNFRIDLEVQAFMIGGYDSSAGRVAYDSASFDSSISSILSGIRGNPAHSSRFNALSFTDALDNLMGRGIDSTRRDDAFDALLRDRLINSNPSDRAALLAEAGRNMSFDRQMAFIAKLGGEMSANYDDARADQAIGATAIPSCDAILGGLASGEKIGVCRDIAMCQAHVLRAMGNTGNVYGISYATPGNYHVSLVATDPNNPNRIHKINYDYRSVESDRSGIAGLAQDHNIPDVGITYRLWEPDGNGGGRMVASLPSQMGLVLNQMTGGNNQRDFDPMVRNQYSTISAGGGVGPWYGRVFAARLANGDQVLGVATHVSWGSRPEESSNVFQGVAHDGSVGLAFAHRIMDRTDGAGAVTQLETNTIYLNLQQRISTPIRIGDRIVIEPQVGIRIQGAAIEGGSAGDRGWTGDGDLGMNFGIRGIYTSSDERTRLILSGGTQLTLGLADIRGLLGSDVIGVVNHSYIEGELEHRVNPDVLLNARLLYVFREYGDSFGASAGATIDWSGGRTGVNLGFTTPVGQANGFMPGGASPSLMVGLSHSILSSDRGHSVLDINGLYTQNLQDGSYNFTGGLGVHF